MFGGVDSKYDKKLSTAKTIANPSYHVKKNYPEFYDLCTRAGLDLKNVRGVLIPTDDSLKKYVDNMVSIEGGDLEKFYSLTKTLGLHLLRDKITKDKVGDKGQIIRTHHRMALKVSEVNSKGVFSILSGSDYKKKTEATLLDVHGAPTKSGQLNYCVGVLKGEIEITPDYNEENMAKLEGGHMEMVEKANARGIKFMIAKQFEDQVVMNKCAYEEFGREMDKEFEKKKKELEKTLDEELKQSKKGKSKEEQDKLESEFYERKEDQIKEIRKYNSKFGTFDYYVPIIAGLMKCAEMCDFREDAECIANHFYPDASAMFYILLQPYCEKQIISNELIEKWCGAPYYPEKKYKVPDFSGFFESFCEKYKTSKKVTYEVRPTTMPKVAEAVYEKTYKKYGNEYCLFKLWADYTAFLFYKIRVGKGGYENCVDKKLQATVELGKNQTGRNYKSDIGFTEADWNKAMQSFTKKKYYKEFAKSQFYCSSCMNISVLPSQSPCMSKYLCSFIRLNTSHEKEEKKEIEPEEIEIKSEES